ncbi:hypothetical protein [Lawsonella clevelandensis]|nr:hypothetical protein [Lawsonella clevelandensis]
MNSKPDPKVQLFVRSPVLDWDKALLYLITEKILVATDGQIDVEFRCHV